MGENARDGFWQGVETLFLDAGGVLLHPDWRRVAQVLAAHGHELGAGRLARAEARARRALDSADGIRASSDAQRWSTYFSDTLRRAGLVVSEAELAGLIGALVAEHLRANLWCHVPDDAVPVLERLRARGLRLVMVSNADGRLAALVSGLGLADHFDHLLDSRVEGLEKPDPRFFQLALARSGARPASTVHVGDLYHVDVAGARAAGLRAALFDPAGLYEEVDCPRLGSLDELARRLGA